MEGLILKTVCYCTETCLGFRITSLLSVIKILLGKKIKKMALLLCVPHFALSKILKPSYSFCVSLGRHSAIYLEFWK